jgi:hypothetical protein
MNCHYETEEFLSRGTGFLQVGGVVEDLLVDFRQDSGVSAEGWGDVFTAQEEANGSFEKYFQLVAIDELREGGHVRCRQDEQVSELTKREISKSKRRRELSG